MPAGPKPRTPPSRGPEATPRKWAWHRRQLLRLRAERISECEDHAAALRLPLEHGGEDLIDVANERSERTTLLAKIRLEEAELAEIDAALRRIDAGTYGICELTGRPIAASRLRSIPWTRSAYSVATPPGGTEEKSPSTGDPRPNRKCNR